MTFSDLFTTANAGKKYIGAQALTDNTGTCAITFPQPNISSWWTGGITVWDSPSSALWLVTVNGITIDVVSGQQSSSSIQVGPNDILAITSTNLQAYLGIAGVTPNPTYHATYTCIESDASNTPLLVPGHDTFFPPQNYGQVFANNISTTVGAGTNVILTLINTSGLGAIYFNVGLNNTANPTDITIQPLTANNISSGLLPQTIWALGGSGAPSQQTEAFIPVTSPFMMFEAKNRSGGNIVVWTLSGVPLGAFGPPRLLPRRLIGELNTSNPSGTFTAYYPGNQNDTAGVNISATVAPGKYTVWVNQLNANTMQPRAQEWDGNTWWDIANFSEATTPGAIQEICLTGNSFRVGFTNLQTIAETGSFIVVGPYE